MANKKTVLVLPGSKWQIELVEKIRETGNTALVVNPYDDSPCFEYADGHLKSDIFDLKKVTEYAESQKIDAVISDECDIAMPLVAEIGDRLGLHTLTPESARLFTDKFLMREFCKNHDLKYPEYCLCKTAEEAVALFRKINRPLIIKPLDSNASHGVFKIESEKDIAEHFDEAMSFSRVEHAVLAERFIQGTEFTIDGIKTPSSHYTLAISEKKHFKHNTSIASDLLFTHSNDRFDYDKLRKTNDAFILNSGLEYGFTHAEYKCENGEYYLIEIAARGGGNKISSVITQYMSGYDTYKYLIACSLGNVTDEDFSLRKEYENRAAVLKFFKTPNGGGRVKKIFGTEVLKNEPDIVEYMLYFNAGDTIEDAKSDSARIGFYIVCSESKEKLNEVINKVESSFKIELE